MCPLLGVKRSRYYSWLRNPKSSRQIEDERIAEEIKKIHKAPKMNNYGKLRITDELKDRGFKVGHNRVGRIMKENNIRAKSSRKFIATTNSDHNFPVAENILNRDFSASAPNQKWVSDITYIQTNEGWLYLCIVMDLYSRRIIGWSMDDNMKTELVIKAVDMAVNSRETTEGLIFHSDQGVQYASNKFRNKLENLGFIQSMSRKGNCWDNACAESFFHTLKTEELYNHKFKTREEAKSCIFEYIEVFYNRTRKHSFLGYLNPVKFEKSKCA